MHSSRDIKRMEGIAKSPVFSHFSNSLQGNNRKLTPQQTSSNSLYHRIDNNQIILCGATAQIRILLPAGDQREHSITILSSC